MIDAIDRRVEIGFALAAAALCTSLWQLSAHPHADDEAPEPGSADEIAARLALADEAS